MLDVQFVVLVSVTIFSSVFFLNYFLKSHVRRNVPAGSLGFPVIGESISFARAGVKDQLEEWVEERVSKYGPVFKTSLMGAPTAIVTGQAGNKFVLSSASDAVLAAKQPKSTSAILGDYELLKLPKNRYMFVKAAMLSFLKPECLQRHLKLMDTTALTTLLHEIKDKDVVHGIHMARKITFDITCTVLFGIHQDEQTKDALMKDFVLACKAAWSIPINFPGTTFNKGLAARQRIINRLLPIIRKKKEDLLNGVLNPRSDMITCLWSLKDKDEEPITEMELMDNLILLMFASHDTAAILSSLMIWKMAQDKNIYQNIRQEHMAILRERQGNEENLTWAETQKMKYTWRVAQEVVRTINPMFGVIRTVVEDTSFDGFDIPKGWQVLCVSSGTHKNKDIFNDPETFDPSRFEPSSKAIPPYAYIPFGGGTHMCIGNEFGRVETLIIIHHLVTKFEWSQVYPDETITRQPLPHLSKGLLIKLKPVDSVSES